MQNRSFIHTFVDRRVALGLFIWWILNLLQAAFTELAHDEAYYFMFSQHLDWGYFDHPPMTALLIWLGSFVGGELGVRLFFTLLQPLYLWILWCIVRPATPHRSDATTFLLASAALPILQLYGFLAVPDVPLLMTAALFLLCYKRFTEDESVLNMLLLGLTMALMAYSKYHGALVVLFTLALNPRIFTRSRIYLSGFFALILIAPHLWWQHTHDWATFAYHLHDRNGAFSFSNLTEHLLNTIAVFNPFFLPVYFLAWKRVKAHNATERALYFMPILFFLFFAFSTLKGRIQPQWLIVASFGFIYLIFQYTREYAGPKLRRYITVVGWATIVLALLMRIELIWNPLGIRFEIFDNRPSFEAIAHEAGDRPIIFGGSYAIASKYNFYTGKPAYCQPDFFYRTSQWQFRDDDTQATGREVLWGILIDGSHPTPPGMNGISLANGQKFVYNVIPSFKPVRLTTVYYNEEMMPEEIAAGDTLSCIVGLTNPYPDTIKVGSDNTQLLLLLSDKKLRRAVPVDLQVVLPPATKEESVTVMTKVKAAIPADLPAQSYDLGFAIQRAPLSFGYNSSKYRIKILSDK